MTHLHPVATRLCLGALPRREREIVAHLLSCAACRKAVTRTARRRPTEHGTPGGAYDYSQVFARVLSRTQAQWSIAEEESRQAPLRFDGLWSLPPSRWREAFAAPCSVAFLSLVLDRALACAAADPRTGERLATLARSAARRRRDLPAALRDELIARSWTAVGSSFAARREWHRADAALTKAGQLLSSRPSPRPEAELCRVLAERHLGRGSSGEALALLARAARLAGESGDVEREVCDLGRQAGILSDQNDLDQAAGLLAAALLRAEDEGLAGTREHLRLRLLWTLQALGLRDEARQVASADAAIATANSVELVLLAAGHACRGETRIAENLLLRGGAAAFEQGDNAVAAAAALQLAQIYLVGSQGEALRLLAPRFESLAAAPNLPLTARAALQALAVALRTEAGAVQPLVLAASAALDQGFRA
jgi:hypothetical protein